MEPQSTETLQLIKQLRTKCRHQAEQIMALRRAYTTEAELNCKQKKEHTKQINMLTSQLVLLESRLIKKQKQISNLLNQREQTIYRQRKLIDNLCLQLTDRGIEVSDITHINIDSINDSDSAVVLDDIDSDCYNSLNSKRKPSPSDVTVVRSISDAIETNMKFPPRRSNCYLKRPDILETVYSVEEDSEPINQTPNITEKRDKFKNRSEKIINDNTDDTSESINKDNITSATAILRSASSPHHASTPHVVNYNRVMLNHRSITRPKDVKYKRINKAKSKSLEELRDKLRHWIDRGTTNPNNNENSCTESHDNNSSHSFA